MVQFLCIGLYGPFTYLPFNCCAIYFDSKVTWDLSIPTFSKNPYNGSIGLSFPSPTIWKSLQFRPDRTIWSFLFLLTWNAKCPISKTIVAGFRGKVALKIAHQRRSR